MLVIFAGYGLLAAGVLLALLAILVFIHARKVELKTASIGNPGLWQPDFGPVSRSSRPPLEMNGLVSCG